MEGTHGETLGFGRARKNMVYKKNKSLPHAYPSAGEKNSNEKKRIKKLEKESKKPADGKNPKKPKIKKRTKKKPKIKKRTGKNSEKEWTNGKKGNNGKKKEKNRKKKDARIGPFFCRFQGYFCFLIAFLRDFFFSALN